MRPHLKIIFNSTKIHYTVIHCFDFELTLCDFIQSTDATKLCTLKIVNKHIKIKIVHDDPPGAKRQIYTI